jgi:hypothetical protein
VAVACTNLVRAIHEHGPCKWIPLSDKLLRVVGDRMINAKNYGLPAIGDEIVIPTAWGDAGFCSDRKYPKYNSTCAQLGKALSARDWLWLDEVD